MKIYPPVKPSLKELHEAAQDREITVSYTPAGPPEGTAYTKRAVSWKKIRAPGLFGGKVPKVATKAEKDALVSELKRHGNLFSALAKAVRVSVDHAGIKGFAIWEIAGMIRGGPMKAFEQAKKQGKPVRLIASRPSITALMKPIPEMTAGLPLAAVTG